MDQVEEVALPAVGDIDANVVANNLSVIENIRLWDVEPLQDAYNQLQFMELYYNFLNMDSDRYVLDGRLRQVLPQQARGRGHRTGRADLRCLPAVR